MPRKVQQPGGGRVSQRCTGVTSAAHRAESSEGRRSPSQCDVEMRQVQCCRIPLTCNIPQAAVASCFVARGLKLRRHPPRWRCPCMLDPPAWPPSGLCSLPGPSYQSLGAAVRPQVRPQAACDRTSLPAGARDQRGGAATRSGGLPKRAMRKGEGVPLPSRARPAAPPLTRACVARGAVYRAFSASKHRPKAFSPGTWGAAPPAHTAAAAVTTKNPVPPGLLSTFYDPKPPHAFIPRPQTLHDCLPPLQAPLNRRHAPLPPRRRPGAVPAVPGPRSGPSRLRLRPAAQQLGTGSGPGQQ